MKKLSSDQISEIINLYSDGMTPKNIGLKFGIFNNSVTRILKKYGISRNQLERVDDSSIKYIIKEYISGKPSTIIANDLNISDSTVGRILKRNKINIRPSEINKRKYEINSNYFELIDSEEKAYFLGLLYADGNISSSRNAMKIMLHPKDIDILEKFSTIIYGFIKIDKSGMNKDGQEYVSVSVYSKKFCSDLVKLGCTPVKTFTIIFPRDLLPENLLWHFIRGFFDGDGCISIANINRPVIDFTSNVIFIEGLKLFLEENGIKCPKSIGINNKNNLTGCIQLHNFENITNLYNLLYKDATIYMNRKYDIFQKFLQIIESKKMKKNTVLDISKYGTTYVPEFNGKLLNSDNIKILSDEEKLLVVEYLFNFYRKHGFPFIKLTDGELIKDFMRLKNLNVSLIEKDNILTLNKQYGNPIFKHFSPQFYEVNSGISKTRLSMLDTFHNDEMLKKVIKNRVHYNFNLTGNMLKQGLSNSKVAYKASIFNSAVAKFIYSKYTKENDIIYDYSMGFGQRLTAALSLPFYIKYVGIDASIKSVNSNQNIFNFFNKNVASLNKEVELTHIGSENYCDPNLLGKVNLAFSSPPYFSLEIYEDDPMQAGYNNDYKYFINTWWRATVANIDKMLTNDGVFILNINETVNKFNIGKDMLNMIEEHGFKLIDTYKIQLTKNLKFANKNGVHKYEPIYIFKRA